VKSDYINHSREEHCGYMLLSNSSMQENVVLLWVYICFHNFEKWHYEGCSKRITKQKKIIPYIDFIF